MLNWLITLVEEQSALSRGLCPLHKCNLESGEVKIRYGLVRHSPELLAARKKSFPQANSYAVGGCYVWEGKPETQKIIYCPVCRAAEAVWLRQKQKNE
jgi:hypothetical protein